MSGISEVLLIHHEISKPQTLPFPYGIIMDAGYFSAITLAPLRTLQVTLKGSVTVRLTPTRIMPGWCYMQLWDTKTEQYTCTCAEGVRGYCQHIHELEVLA